MATINIPDAIFRQLEAIAAARHLSIDAYLDEVVRQNGSLHADSERQLAALESFSSGMGAWTIAHVPPGHIVDDSRETIYDGRG